MADVSSVHLVGRQIGSLEVPLLGKTSGPPGQTHARVEVRYRDGSERDYESADGYGVLLMPHAPYADRSKPLFDVNVPAPHGSTLNAFADRIERASQHFAGKLHYYGYVTHNSNSMAIGLLGAAGADTRAVTNAAEAQMSRERVPVHLPFSLGTPLGTLPVDVQLSFPVQNNGLREPLAPREFAP